MSATSSSPRTDLHVPTEDATYRLPGGTELTVEDVGDRFVMFSTAAGPIEWTLERTADAIRDGRLEPAT